MENNNGTPEVEKQNSECASPESRDSDDKIKEETEKKAADAGAEPAGGSENSAGAGGNSAKPDKNLSPEQKIAELEAQNADLKDQFLRKAADFENYRKRSIREKQEAIDYANQNLLLDLIPILDDFDRALAAVEKSAKSEADFDNFKEGVKLIEQRVYSTLENKWALKRFESAGKPFDPERHEALASEKSADVREATVQDDFVKGYTLKDRVIRTAKVKVLMPEDSN